MMESSVETTDQNDAPVSAPAAELRASLKHLRTEIRGSVFVMKLLLFAALSAAGIVMACQPQWWYKVLGVALTGLMFAHAAELQHETLHNLGFRSRVANTVAGIVLGVPMLVSFTDYRVAHLRHHRYLGDPANREFFDYGDQYGQDGRSGAAAVLSWSARFTMIRHYQMVLASTARALSGRAFREQTATNSRRIRRDYLIILATVLAVAAASVALHRAVIVWAWLVPLVVVAGPVHALIELPEHHRCRTLTTDPFANTRTIRSNALMAWFTNGNNFHVEHHVMPNLPIERLPDLHQEIRGRLQFFHKSYVDYFRKLLSQ
jgi:fatty acid desaturase